ncbi:MAG: type VI secretion system ATPase TssH, partial [Oscillospiraceae bacterium]|nr:type VI secretion system ATPase TssH [Oscillospiraceae bacterium]
PLTKDNIGHIVDLQIAALNERLSAQQLKIELTQDAKQIVVDGGYDPTFGARPLRRYIQKNVETLAARKILSGSVLPGQTIVIGAKDGSLTADTE